MVMQEMRNSSGTSGVFHNGCSRGPLKSIRLPSDDWCMVGSRIPSAAIQISALLRMRFELAENFASLGLLLFSHFSKNAGASSIHSTMT